MNVIHHFLFLKLKANFINLHILYFVSCNFLSLDFNYELSLYNDVFFQNQMNYLLFIVHCITFPMNWSILFLFYKYIYICNQF